MINGQTVTVVMPAYNASATLARTVAELDRRIVDTVLVVDDHSDDATADHARALGFPVVEHDRNRGYGANQKTCYTWALDHQADIIVMVHPDYQYTPRLVPALAAMVAYGVYDVALASRILDGGARTGGMPRYKYVANRALTIIENACLGLHLSEYHTGYRAFTRRVLEAIPFQANADDFLFDNQILAQIAAAPFRIGELACPTHYAADSSSLTGRAAVRYGLGVLRTALTYGFARWVGIPVGSPLPLESSSESVR
jgi:glycosyltransferase involved in cell wall biosynthesis